MNNLQQTRQEAKRLYLKHQQEKVLKHPGKADRSERIAVVRHTDGFLPSTTPEGKIFWLKICERLERIADRIE